jgi:carboxypeptidase Q
MKTTFRVGALLWAAGLAVLLPSCSTPTAQRGTPGASVKAAATPAANRPTAIVQGKEVPVPAIPMGDAATIRRILAEGQSRNQVMQHLQHLCEQIGHRLTGSSQIDKASEWVQSEYRTWGMENVRTEQWGTIATRFDRGEGTGKMLLRRDKKEDDGTVKTDYSTLRDFALTTLSWTRGTNGPVRGVIVREPQTEDEYNAVKDKLSGAWVLLKAPDPVGQRGIRGMLGSRFSLRLDARKKVAEGKKPEELSIPERLALLPVAGYLSTSSDERVWTGAAPGWRERTLAEIPNDVHVLVRQSDYDAINSRISDGHPIEVEIDLQHTLTAGPIPVFNTIAEIRGSELPDEYVIVSGHMDSWDGPGSQGCTDNGTGTAVTMEAARILKAVGAKPKRTILFIHWTGEEQGLLGSRAWIEQHPDKLPKISAVFVDDGGTNTQGGLQAADQMSDMLAAATAPINNLFYSATDKKFLNVNVQRNGPRLKGGGGSDHASFNAKEIPGFFWDEVGRADYPHGWHTQFDRFDLAIEEYLVQSATTSAVTAYQLACAPTLLPRNLPAEPEKKDERTEPTKPSTESAASGTAKPTN